MSIKNIVFDMGGVLIDFDPDKSIRNHFDEKYYDIVRRNTFDSNDWMPMDKGTVSVEDSISAMCSRIPAELHEEVRKMITSHETEMPPIAEMYDLVKSLKENGYKIYLLSNCPDWFNEFKKSVPAFDFFDGFIVSALYNQVKPDEEIYYTLFNEFKLKPQECFFVDDSQINIDVAVKLGMSAYCFKGRNIPALKSAMKEKGVKI